MLPVSQSIHVYLFCIFQHENMVSNCNIQKRGIDACIRQFHSLDKLADVCTLT
jgi:hypothetical protein